MGRHNQDKSHGHHKKREKFLEVCLLCLLFEESSHGYRLMEKLQPFGIYADEIDIGSLYRTLRKLEEKEWVVSVWEGSDQGPKRRNYSITKEGKGILKEHMAHIKRRIHSMEALLRAYERIDTRADEND